MFNARLLLALASLGSVATSAWGQAATAPGQPEPDFAFASRFSAEAGYRYENLGLPRMSGADYQIRRNGAVVPYATHDGLRIETHGATATVGFTVKDLPAGWPGGALRLEIFGGFQSGAGESRIATPLAAGSFLVFPRLDGRTRGVNGSSSASPLSYSALETSVDAYRLGFKAALRVAVAPGWMLSPWLAVSAEYTHTHQEKLLSFPEFRQAYTTDVNLRSVGIGGEFGARLTYRPLPWLSLYGAGHVGAVHRRTSMDAVQCGSQAFTDRCTGNFYLESGAASASATALRAGGEGGVAIHLFQSLIVALSGGAVYDSAVPGFRSPQTPPGAGARGTPAGIDHSGHVSYFGQARLVWRF